MTYAEFRKICFPAVAGLHGSPQGRDSYRTLGERPAKAHDRRVPLNAGGYDPGGAYWGTGGPPLRCMFTATGSVRIFYRGWKAGDMQRAGFVRTLRAAP